MYFTKWQHNIGMRKTYLVCTLLDILMNASGKSVSEKSSNIKYNITFAYDDTRRSSFECKRYVRSSYIFYNFCRFIEKFTVYDIITNKFNAISTQFVKGWFLNSPTDAFSFTLHGLCVPRTGFISPFTFFNIPIVMMTVSFRLYDDFKPFLFFLF